LKRKGKVKTNEESPREGKLPESAPQMTFRSPALCPEHHIGERGERKINDSSPLPFTTKRGKEGEICGFWREKEGPHGWVLRRGK